MDTVFVPGRGEVRLGKKIKSPLPDHIRGKPDRHASFSLYRCKGKKDLILWKDQGTGATGTYNQLMKILGHAGALKLFGKPEFDVFTPMQTIKPDFAEIKSYKERMWTPDDEKLWHNYGVLIQAHKKYKTLLIETFTYVKDEIEHELTCENSQICIWLYEGLMKMYRIDEKVKAKKHLTLGSGDGIFGLDSVPHGTSDVFLVGGQKDCLALYSNTGYYGIALNSETADMTPIQYYEIKRKAKKIWCWYDDDDAGHTGRQKLMKSYLIQSLKKVPPLSLPRMQRDPANWFRDMILRGLNFAQRREEFLKHWNDGKNIQS
jgi:hypothetical protein